MACRSIPLSKNPGVRPIGIGEVLRRIIGKVVMATLRNDITASAGNFQLCAGQKSGCEIAIHSGNEIFAEEETQGLLQIDTNNAFNSINRNVLTQNLNIICPEFAKFVQNCYAISARLFVTGGKELESNVAENQENKKNARA